MTKLPEHVLPRPRRRIWWLLPAAVGVGLLLLVGVGPSAYHTVRLVAAVAAERRDDFATADRELTACLRRRPADPEAHLLAARLGWRSRLGEPLPDGDWVATLRRHLRAADADPALTDRVVTEGQLIDALVGPHAPAAAMLNKRLEAGGPDEVPILEAVAWGGVLAHQFPPSLAALDRLLVLRPDRAAAHYLRGLVRELSNGAAGSPADDYRRAVTLDAANRLYRHALARSLLADVNAAGETLALYESLAAGDPSDSAAGFGVGHCQLALGDHAAAADTLRRVTAARPADGVAWAEYGQAVLAGGDAAAAEPLLRRGVDLAPNARAGNYHLGLCLGRLGRWDDAQPFLTAADRIRTDTQRVHELSRELLADPAAGAARRCELGELLVRTGKPVPGRYWLESALVIDPNYAPARATLAALDGVTASPGRRPGP